MFILLFFHERGLLESSMVLICFDI